MQIDPRWRNRRRGSKKEKTAVRLEGEDAWEEQCT
jgi:hypothetical protein